MHATNFLNPIDFRRHQHQFFFLLLTSLDAANELILNTGIIIVFAIYLREYENIQLSSVELLLSSCCYISIPKNDETYYTTVISMGRTVECLVFGLANAINQPPRSHCLTKHHINKKLRKQQTIQMMSGKCWYGSSAVCSFLFQMPSSIQQSIILTMKPSLTLPPPFVKQPSNGQPCESIPMLLAAVVSTCPVRVDDKSGQLARTRLVMGG